MVGTDDIQSSAETPMSNTSTSDGNEPTDEHTNQQSGLVDRLDRLEAENGALRSENEELRIRLDDLEGAVTEVIGPTTPGSPANDSDQAALDRANPAAADQTGLVQPDGGEAYKVVGDFDAAGGIGVLGRNTAPTGTTYGVTGVSESSDSTAAAVNAIADNGALGVSATTNGNYGLDVDTTDHSAIRADTDGEHFNAVHGINSATTGWSWGVRGDTHSESENAYGVRGLAEATSGAPVGVGGETAGTDDGAAGVRGHATASGIDAGTVGVEGITEANADNNAAVEIVPAGVEGTATGENATHGIRGTSNSVRGRGVVGFATSDDYDHSTFTGSAIGMSGVTDRSSDDSSLSDAGGVFGWATATSGTAYGVLGRNASPDGWGVLAMDTSDEGHALYANGDSELDGDTSVGGDTDIGGELAFSDATPQRTAGPIAKGFINLDGSIENAVNVASAQWHETEERYRINISGEHYWFDNYVTVLTTVNPGSSARVTSNSGDLVVEVTDDDGNNIQSQFQFVTYDLPTGAQTTASETSELETTDDNGSEIDGHEGAASAV